MVRLATRHRFPLPLGLLALLGVLAMASPLAAQSYPSGMIRIVNGNAPGTPPDIVSRVVANDLSESEHWYVVVENKVGAIGTIGAAEVLKQPADGQTILSIAFLLDQQASVSPERLETLARVAAKRRVDEHISLNDTVAKLASAYHVLVVHPSVSARSLSELVALLKSEPDKFTFSSGGFGTPAHLAGELFKLQTGVRATHVPYQALPRAIGDLLNGTNQYQFISPLPVVDLINAGKLRAIAVTGPARLPALKDVPTVGEAGFPDLIIQDWFGLLVKRGTPETVIVQLNQAVNRSLQKPRVREAIEKMAAEPAGGTPEEFGKFVSSQLAYWGNVVKNSGITIQQ